LRSKSILTQLDALITPSKFGQRVFIDSGMRAEQCHVLPWFSEHRAPVPLPEKNLNPLTLAYVGRISTEKSVALVFDALLSLRNVKPLQLLIAGDYNNKYGLQLQKRYKRSVGIHTVEWLGYCDPSQVLARAHSLIALSTGIDNTPLSLIEALAYGLTALVTRTPVTEELVIEGTNGVLVELDDSASVTEGLSRLIKMHGKQTTRHLPLEKVYTLKEYTHEIEKVYLSVVNR
jgi:glycosyltransferase involved in cell wall biosynthesis